MNNEVNTWENEVDVVSVPEPETTATVVTTDQLLRQQFADLLEAEPGRPRGGVHPNVLRRSCALAHEKGIRAEDLHQLLIDGGWKPNLACQIKNVFQSPEVCQEFLRPQDPITWREAIDKSQKALVAKLQVIIAELDQAESDANGGYFLRLCQLAREWAQDPETFRQLLVRAGLAHSRASEIKCVLECAPACRDFVQAKDGITWRQALERARRQRTTELKQAARRLVGVVFRRWECCDGFKLDKLKFSITRGPHGDFILDHVAGVLTIEPIMHLAAEDDPSTAGAKP